jgi:hypothetical protein
MIPRGWAERQFWARAAFTLTFFIIAALLFVYYRILYRPLLFPGNPWLSIGLPAFIIALMVSIGVGRAVKRSQMM